MKTTMRKKPGKNQALQVLKPVGSANWLLFKHMADNYGLTLLESELDEICRVVIKMRPGIDLRGFTAKQWAEIRRSYRNTPNTKVSSGDEP